MNVSDAFNGHDPSQDILTKYPPLEVLWLHTFERWKSIGICNSMACSAIWDKLHE